MPRLIDADRLRKDVLDMPNCYNGFSDTYDKSAIIGMIDEQPTVEPKHGHWINASISANGHEYSYEAECDLCGARVHNNFSSVINYCPRCGAKMDEDEWQEPEEPNINPCRGCDDYDGQGGCKSNGGCGTWIRMDEVK